MRVNVQLPRQVVQIIALSVLLIVHQHHTGQVNLGSNRRIPGKLGEIRRIQGLGDFSIQPLQLRVVGMPAQFGGDHLLFFSSIRPSALAAAISARSTAWLWASASAPAS
jgi:hypothetical protein